MTDQSIKFYHRAINNTVQNIRRVYVPVVRGTNSRIYIIETLDGTKTVFRFNSRQIAHRNYDISKVLRAQDIPVPEIDLHLYQGQYFETYPYISGQTFQECLNMGMSKSEILNTYAIMANQIHKMLNVPLHNFQNIENKNCSSVAQSNVVHKSGLWSFGQCVKYGTKLLNTGKQHICHCDFTPRNIVLDNKKQLTILDLNAVSIANINFALALTGMSLRANKLNPHEFYRVCDDIIPGQIQPKRIDFTEQICSLYFHGYRR
ncbi:MAG: hypothetical protein J6Q44_01805 [Alphaproteobacteria bacterium]|nr:hypothetical protein [Alphaproteobacteria bacterium]